MRRGPPVRKDTIFHLASCGKQFTGLGILMLAIPEIETPVAILAEPGCDEPAGEPFPPRSLEGHTPPNRHHGERNAESRENHQQVGLAKDFLAVAKLQCVEKVSIPEI